MVFSAVFQIKINLNISRSAHTSRDAIPRVISYFRDMKILTLSKFYHPYRGGIETVTKDITDSNIKEGHQSDVLCANTSRMNEISKIERSTVIRSAKFLTIKSTSICPYMPWQLRVLIPRYDIIHVHFPDPMTAISLFLTKPHIPFIIHWHSDIIKQKKLMTFFGPLQKWCLENAMAIVVTSEAYLQHSIDLKPFTKKVKVIPIGIKKIAEKTERKLSDKKRILAVGRLTYYKGFKYLVEASSLLSKDYEIIIVGDGELKGELEELIEKKNLKDKVFLVGSLSSEDLQSLYQSSDIFCFPSTHKSEAFGVAIIEAMSYSLPVVSCNIEGSGVPWVNQHQETGLNVKPCDHFALAAAIETIAEDPLLFKKFSHNSFERFQREFNLDVMMKKIWDIYQA